jgi:hypothetical protein
MSKFINIPRYIQRCILTKKSSIKVKSNVNVHELLDFEYMGSSEFEFGAIPKCFRELEKDFEDLRIFEVDLTKAIHGNMIEGTAPHCKVFLLCTQEKFDEYVPYLALIAQNKHRLKEPSNFDRYFIEPSSWSSGFKADFWLDIDNGVAWTFRAYDLECFKKALVNTIARWNAEKAIKS